MVRNLQQANPKKKAARERQRSTAQKAAAVLKYESVKDLSRRFSLNRTDIQHIFGIPKSTQFRYEKENPVLKPSVVDRLERFGRICQQAVELFEDESEAQHWLTTPKVTLEGQTPLSVLATDAGAKKVEEILYRAEYGMFG